MREFYADELKQGDPVPDIWPYSDKKIWIIDGELVAFPIHRPEDYVHRTRSLRFPLVGSKGLK